MLNLNALTFGDLLFSEHRSEPHATKAPCNNRIQIMLKRRPFILSVTAGTLLTMDRKVFARDWNSVSNILEQAVANHILRAASVYLRIEDEIFQQHYGAATSSRSAFLLGSITKPMAIAAVMKLYDQGVFQLDDPAVKFLPEFTGEGRDQITIRHLLTHTSGLPDQLPDNDQQRRSHASLQ